MSNIHNLFLYKVWKINVTKRDSKSPAPHLKLLDVKNRAFFIRKNQDNVFTGKESLQTDLWFEV